MDKHYTVELTSRTNDRVCVIEGILSSSPARAREVAMLQMALPSTWFPSSCKFTDEKTLTRMKA